jgi:hypothetical protein
MNRAGEIKAQGRRPKPEVKIHALTGNARQNWNRTPPSKPTIYILIDAPLSQFFPVQVLWDFGFCVLRFWRLVFSSRSRLIKVDKGSNENQALGNRFFLRAPA